MFFAPVPDDEEVSAGLGNPEVDVGGVGQDADLGAEWSRLARLGDCGVRSVITPASVAPARVDHPAPGVAATA